MRRSLSVRTPRLGPERAAEDADSADKRMEESRQGWARAVRFHLRQQRKLEGRAVLELDDHRRGSWDDPDCAA